jgi:glycosyltransferase involved in cell wall biosynthesis
MINKNILLFIPMIDGGGVEKNFFIIANFFVKYFKKVTVITTSKEFKSKLNKNIEFITPKNFFWSKTQNRRFKIVICLYLVFKYFIENKKFTALSFHGNLYCCLLCKLLGQKIILRSNSSISGWSKNFLKTFVYKNISKMADRIIVNSIDFKKEYKKVFNLNVSYIYNPLNKKEILKKSKLKTKIPLFKKNTLNFLNIGRLVDQKDQITILKAFKLIKAKTKIKFKLLIIGRGIKKKELENFIFKNNLFSDIKIIDFKKNPYPYFKNSDCFILSSLYEGLPNVLLESLCLKKFVISTKCPTGPKEILDNGKGGFLFKIKNEKDLYYKIIYYSKNRKKCNKFIKHGHKRLTRFDLNLNLKKYIKLINL